MNPGVTPTQMAVSTETGLPQIRHHSTGDFPSEFFLGNTFFTR